MRRIIFLDIDGVLNSQKYDRERSVYDSFIDESRLVLLKRLVDRTDAEIVLTTTWRLHWGPSDAECDSIGRGINAVFEKYGLKIADKTPVIADHKRTDEIKAWLGIHGSECESFVIIDDINFNWQELMPSVVKTSFTKGRGLEEEHVELAYGILVRAKGE